MSVLAGADERAIGEKPFACRCGKGFTRLDNLRQHASTIHADEPEANEELFTRLAAHMPRSGQKARRQLAQKKASTPPSFEGITSPSVLQDGFSNLPPMPASALIASPLGPAYAAPYHSQSSSSNPLPSASFRFPPTNTGTPAGSSYRASAYQGYSSHTTSRSWSSSASNQPPLPTQSPHFQQHANFQSPPPKQPNQTNLSPVPAIGGGSHFRDYPSTPSIPKPTARVQSPRSGNGSTPFGELSIPSTASSGSSSQYGVASAPATTRPVLPCTSSRGFD